MKNVFIWALFSPLTQSQSSESLVEIFISTENFFNIENSFSHFSDFSGAAQSYARITIRRKRKKTMKNVSNEANSQLHSWTQQSDAEWEAEKRVVKNLKI